MLLCDVGNTSYHFLDGTNDYKKNVVTFNPSSVMQTVYYISVNQDTNAILAKLENWIDLSKRVDTTKYYQTMGIDRIFAVESVDNAVIVDAGSAVTVDMVKNGKFEGGFIYPGVKAMKETYENISPALAYSFNFECDLDIIPKSSQDAISYGYLKTLYSEVTSHKMPVIITGGDALEFKKIFKTAKVDELLIFKGMKKIMKKAKLC